MSAPGLKLLVNGIQFEHAFSSAVFEAPDAEVTSTPKRPLKWQTTSLGRLWKWDWLPILKDQWFELLNQVRKCGIWMNLGDKSRPNSVRWCKSQRHLSRCGLLLVSLNSQREQGAPSYSTNLPSRINEKPWVKCITWSPPHSFIYLFND